MKKAIVNFLLWVLMFTSMFVLTGAAIGLAVQCYDVGEYARCGSWSAMSVICITHFVRLMLVPENNRKKAETNCHCKHESH